VVLYFDCLAVNNTRVTLRLLLTCEKHQLNMKEGASGRL